MRHLRLPFIAPRERLLGAAVCTLSLLCGCADPAEEGGDATSDTDTNETANTDTAGDETGTTTGEDQLCGNGELDPDEDCDDGNTLDLDECSSTCELPGATRWEHFYHGPLMDRDEGFGAAIDEMGNVYATGWETVGPDDTGDDLDILLRKHSPTGEALWTRNYDGLTIATIEQGRAIVATPGGGVIMLASDYSAPTYDGIDIRLMRIDGDGETVFDVIYAGPANLSDSASALALDEAKGRVFVGGQQDLDAVDSAAWVGVFDSSTGQLQNERLLTDFGGGLLTGVSELALLDDGRLGLVGRVYFELDNNADAWVGVMDDSFQLAWEDSIDVNGGFDVSSGVAAITGGLVICATVEGDSDDMWVRRYTLEGQEVWTDVFDGPMGLRDNCVDLVVDDVDNITVVGRTAIEATNPPTWSPRVAKYDPDGNLAWVLDNTNTDFTGSQYFRDIALGPDREFATVGVNSLGGEITQVWIRVFGP